MTSRRLCTHFFLGSAALRSSWTACAAASSVAHDILALLRRRLHSHRTDAACCRTSSGLKLATQAQSIMRGGKVGLSAWKGLPDGLASHPAVRPAVPDAEVAGTFHAPPYQFFLPDLQGWSAHVIYVLQYVRARVDWIMFWWNLPEHFCHVEKVAGLVTSKGTGAWPQHARNAPPCSPFSCKRCINSSEGPMSTTPLKEASCCRPFKAVAEQITCVSVLRTSTKPNATPKSALIANFPVTPWHVTGIVEPACP